MKKHAVNSVWLMADMGVSAVLGMVVTAAMARTLGPAALGSYSYVFGLAGLLGMFGHMGLDGLLMRELVERPGEPGLTLGTVFWVKMAGFLVGSAALLGFGLLYPAHSHAEQGLFALAALALLAGALGNVISNWFRAMSRPAPAAIASLSANGLGALAKLGLLVTGAGVLAMGAVQAGSVILATLLAMLAYRRSRGAVRQPWRFRADRARQLLGESWLLFVGSLFAAIYITVDLTLVRLILGPEAAGLYAVPSRCIQICHILAIAISTTMFPALTAARQTDAGAMLRILHVSCCALVLAAYAAILAALVGGDAVLGLVFGKAYAASGWLLVLMALSLPLAFCRYMITRWVILERQGRFLVASEAAGAVTALLVNLLLLPRIGMAGAPVATFLAYLVTTLLALLLLPAGRPLFGVIVSALVNPVGPLLALRQQRLDARLGMS